MITTLAILALLALLGSGVVFATSIVIGGVGSFVLAYSLAVLGITLIFFAGVIERLDKIVAALRQDASTRTPAEPKPASAACGSASPRTRQREVAELRDAVADGT